MASAELFRLYRNGQTATVDQIKSVLYSSGQEEPQPLPVDPGEPNFREIANGNLGGRRAQRMREGDDGRTHREKPQKAKDSEPRPRAGTILPYYREVFSQDMLSATGTEGRSIGHLRRGRIHKDRGGIRSPFGRR